MTEQELKVQQKQEVQGRGENTTTEKVFVPAVDIYETDQGVTVIAEMPGVPTSGVELHLEEDVLTIRGTMREELPAGFRPLLQEYENGNYLRRFTVAESIDQEKISASLRDGLLTIVLPKMAPAAPRKISIKVN